MMRSAAPSEGPVSYRNVSLDGDRVLACTQLGLYLVAERDERPAIFIARTERGYRDAITIEVLAAKREAADSCLAEIRNAMRKRNVYRGHIVSLSVGDHDLRVTFHHLPKITREQIILPAGVLERVERESIGFRRTQIVCGDAISSAACCFTAHRARARR